ncbi:MAG: CoA-binding protein [Candidatus Eisenbacteria bacterium]
MDLEERSIIIVGASHKRDRFANKAVRAYKELGWIVYPVHPIDREVEGLPCSPTVADVPGRAAWMSLYVPPKNGLSVVEQAPAKGVRDVYVNPGAGSPELIAKIESLGMNPIEACSIVAIGRSPSEFPSA